MENKTAILLGNTSSTNNIAAMYRTTTNVSFEQKDLASSNVDSLSFVSIEIRIYA